MVTTLLLTAPNLDPEWAFQLSLKIGGKNEVDTGNITVAPQARRANFGLFNYPVAHGGFAPGLTLTVTPDYGDAIVLDTELVPKTTAGMYVSAVKL